MASVEFLLRNMLRLLTVTVNNATKKDWPLLIKTEFISRTVSFRT